MVDRREDAIKHWNELLWASPDHGAIVDAIAGTQRRGGMALGDRPFCNVARPRFVTREEMATEHRAVSHLARAARRVRDAVLDDQKLHAAYLGTLDRWVGTILPLEPRVPDVRSILRFDSFTSEKGIKFVELNGDIPMGSVCNDGIVPIFRALPFFERFIERYDVRPNLVQVGMTQTFLHAWQAWGGTGTPRICVAAFHGHMEEVFAELNVREMTKLGLDAVLAGPEDMDYRDGKLLCKGRAVDVLYRIMHTDDCLAEAGAIRPILDAVKDRAVCMVNPFRSELLSHKFLFALLTDDAHDFRFTKEEAASIKAHVPWGRILTEGRTTGPEGETVDLVEYVAGHRENLVLKPAHAAGGEGVRLGWTTDEATWAAAVRDALDGGHVVQEKVEVTRETYPALEVGFPLRDYYEDTDPFHFPGGYSSVMTRVSAAEITNMAQGGSIIPTFVLDPR